MKPRTFQFIISCALLFGCQLTASPPASASEAGLIPDNRSISGEKRLVFGTTNDDMARSVAASEGEVVIGGQQNLRDVVDHKESSGFACALNSAAWACEPTSWKSIDAPGAKAEVWGVAALPSGEIIVAGKTNGPIQDCLDFNRGEDGFVGSVIATPPACAHFSMNHNDEGLGLAIGPNYTYVVGTVGLAGHQDALIIRYEGTDFGPDRTASEFSFGGPGLEEIFDVAVGRNGMVYVTGRTANDLVTRCRELGAQCWGSDISGNGTDLFVVGIRSDGAGMKLSWLYQQEALYSTGQSLAFYEENGRQHLVAVGEIDEGFDAATDANCKSKNDRNDGYTWTNGLVLKFDLGDSGVPSDPETDLDVRTYGDCTDDTVSAANGETFKGVAVGDTYIFVVGAMRAAGAVCPGTPFFPHCESNDLENAVLLALNKNDLSVHESYEFAGDTGGGNHIEIFFDVAVEAGTIYMVGLTRSTHSGQLPSGGTDAFVVMVDEPN